MGNTVYTAMIACVVKWIRKRTTAPEVLSSNPHEYQQQKRVKVRVRLLKEVTGLGTTKVRRSGW